MKLDARCLIRWQRNGVDPAQSQRNERKSWIVKQISIWQTLLTHWVLFSNKYLLWCNSTANSERKHWTHRHRFVLLMKHWSWKSGWTWNVLTAKRVDYELFSSSWLIKNLMINIEKIPEYLIFVYFVISFSHKLCYDAPLKPVRHSHVFKCFTSLNSL